MNTDDDYAAYAQPSGSKGIDLAQLQDLAEQQAKAEAEVARIEADLNAARERLKDLSERRVPELMDEIGLGDFTTRTGLKITIEETIRASIPKPRSYEAFTWLINNNHAALIKRSVSVDFGKGEDEKAKELEAYLSKQGYAPENNANVHSQTLSAWVREKLKMGEEIPLDLFGVFRQRVSKIKKVS